MLGPYDAGASFDIEHLFTGEIPVPYVFGEAADAIAAHLDLAAVGIKNFHCEISALRRIEQQHLISTDSESTVAIPDRECRRIRQFECPAVDDDEVVSGSVHLCERYLHRINSGIDSPRSRSAYVSRLRTRANFVPLTITSATLGRLL